MQTTITRQQLLAQMQTSRYFTIQELVCSHVYQRFGNQSWQFIHTHLLHTLFQVRQGINKPIHINNWARGGSFSQRGLRCNLCQLASTKSANKQLYLSSHCLGAGVDFDVKGMSAPQVRSWIKQHQHLLPHPIRLESDVNWVHLDVYDMLNCKMINYFKG